MLMCILSKNLITSCSVTMMLLLHLRVRLLFFFSSRRRHTRCSRDWSSDVCSSDLIDNILHPAGNQGAAGKHNHRKLRPAVLDRSGDCLAVHFWHFIINNYGICGIRIDKIQSQASARGSENTKAQSLKNSFEHGQARLVVIDPYQCLWLWSRNFNLQPKLGPGNATVARRETPLTRRCD